LIFQLTLLSGQQFFIKYNHRRLQFIQQNLELFQLSRPYQSFCIWAVQALQCLPDDLQAGRIGQKCKLDKAFFGRQQGALISQIDTDKNGSFLRFSSFIKSCINRRLLLAYFLFQPVSV
jgi:hypothetical protein